MYTVFPKRDSSTRSEAFCGFCWEIHCTPEGEQRYEGNWTRGDAETAELKSSRYNKNARREPWWEGGGGGAYFVSPYVSYEYE